MTPIAESLEATVVDMLLATAEESEAREIVATMVADKTYLPGLHGSAGY